MSDEGLSKTNEEIVRLLNDAIASGRPSTVTDLISSDSDTLQYVIARFCEMNEYNAVASLIVGRHISPDFISQAIEAGVDSSLVMLLANHVCRQRDTIKHMMEGLDDKEE